MLFRFLSKPIKVRIAPNHPHLIPLKHAHTCVDRYGGGKWLCVGTGNRTKNLRHVWGRTAREAYELYALLYKLPTTKGAQRCLS